jgi:heme-degrading monooxygenase HmoA
MIERHINFDVLPGRTDDFERFFARRYRPAALTMPGIVECSLLREVERPERYQMVFRWETAEQALAWRTGEVHEALQPELRSLNSGMEIVAYVQVA